jgi:hypothetical protein
MSSLKFLGANRPVDARRIGQDATRFDSWPAQDGCCGARSYPKHCDGSQNRSYSQVVTTRHCGDITA